MNNIPRAWHFIHGPQTLPCLIHYEFRKLSQHLGYNLHAATEHWMSVINPAKIQGLVSSASGTTKICNGIFRERNYYVKCQPRGQFDRDNRGWITGEPEMDKRILPVSIFIVCVSVRWKINKLLELMAVIFLDSLLIRFFL